MAVPEDRELSLSRQAYLLEINRTGIYYKPAPINENESTIKRIIDEIYTAHPEFGYRRVLRILMRDYGTMINRKRTQRLIREMDIHEFCPGPNQI